METSGGYSMTIDDLKRLASHQHDDENLWFVAETASEAYLQEALRHLHGMIEAIEKVSMSGAVIEQIGFWNKTCKAYLKCIKRKNKQINSLQMENLSLKAMVNELMLEKAQPDNQ